jgi:hypothetical protein
VPEKRKFYADSLSVITTILPSEKSPQTGWNAPLRPKMPGFIALKRIPVQKWRDRPPPPPFALSPEIYPLSGLVSGVML